ncbi:DNA-binding protein [Pontibacter diazotrophicus]|uniref:DNA-binding protein n=1 Tax=Pontibacter diazotrophicus TaxID=1400979 RepID=A0A3D8LGK0_9BACT|nr:helix-turn-helix domain-containing protein [Pontibacter diazotrophicus]RDV16540.1 DNA-binding protein [Pontibacter diazotrophicus]
MKPEFKPPHDLLMYQSADEFIERVAQRVVQLQKESGPTPSDSYLKKEDEELMRTPEVCKLFNITRKTLDVWRNEGRIPFHRVNSRVYFFRSEVLAAMEEPKRLPGSRGTGKQSLGKTPYISKAA